MPAKSKAQRKLFGIAKAVQQGKLSPDEVSGAASKIAKNVSLSDIDKFAKTKEKGLPQHVEERLKEYIRKQIKEILSEKELNEENQIKEIPVEGKLSYDGEWWITLFTEKSTFAIGPADEYKIPDELVELMKLNDLLNI